MTPARRPPQATDEFLTVAEVAATLKLNGQTIRNWIDAGKLPAVRIGRRVRVLRRDLDELIEGGRTTSHPAELPDPHEDAHQFWGG
jgi:excisionase family DNA binding protein